MIRKRFVLCERNKAVIIYARGVRCFRAIDVALLDEFEDCSMSDVHTYLRRFLEKDILTRERTGGRVYWRLSDRLEANVPAIYRGEK